jgi:hypothetical protein
MLKVEVDALALIEQRAAEVPASVVLTGWNVTSSHEGKAAGSVSVAVNGISRSAEATGNGPVDALFRAVDDTLQPALGWHPVLTEYEIKAVSAGEDAQAFEPLAVGELALEGELAGLGVFLGGAVDAEAVDEKRLQLPDESLTNALTYIVTPEAGNLVNVAEVSAAWRFITLPVMLSAIAMSR